MLIETLIFYYFDYQNHTYHNYKTQTYNNRIGTFSCVHWKHCKLIKKQRTNFCMSNKLFGHRFNSSIKVCLRAADHFVVDVYLLSWIWHCSVKKYVTAIVMCLVLKFKINYINKLGHVSEL